MAVRPGGQVATAVRSRSDRDGISCRDLPENAAYRAVTFSGRSRREGEEDELLVVVPQLLSHQELLHTTIENRVNNDLARW
ncbi:hypothetical protein Taro_036977 [Colocasia esculenta]|uniref:Uncharacterized protein n=1 Tax=Colocasia esculenta TaxID=4460 RepID=A0A843W2Y4_COLES|nr:hypothetical protein [Colocasia esculenta]